MYTLILIIALIFAGITIPYALKQKDSIPEEIIERTLEKELNLPDHSIDFSPDSDKK